MNKDVKYKVLENETYDEYCQRLYRNKEAYGLKHEIIGFLINEAFPEEKKDESAHRKNFKKYMEGFDDGYAKALKELEGSEKPSEASGMKTLVPKTHLEKLEEILGEYTIAKQDMRWERNELAREVRDAVGSVLLAQQYKELLLQGLVEMPKYDPKPFVKQGAVMKVLPSDWHIGVVVDEMYNQFDIDIAWDRLKDYADRCIEIAKVMNVGKISITGMGDFTEHLYMRNPQKYDCELNSSQQIAVAQKLFHEFIMIFVNEGYEVEVSAVYGNHDRINGNKKDNVQGDTAIYTIMTNIRNNLDFYNSRAENPITNLKILGTEDLYKTHTDSFFGRNFKYVHGDDEAKNNQQKVANHSRIDQIEYDYLVMGHLHHFEVVQFDRGQHHMYCGTLQGANSYGKNQVKSLVNAGQSIIIIRENGDIIPMDFNLQ